MLIKIAWRNLWRNKRRSLIILLSIIIGVASLMILDVLMRGMTHQMLVNRIKSEISEMQIHSKGFNDNKVISNYIPELDEVELYLNKSGIIKNFSKRIIAAGMLSSANSSSGIIMTGVEYDNEIKVTDLHTYITSGKYLSGVRNEIIIGKKLADKLEVDLGDKIVAVSADVEGEVTSELFRVSGIFKSTSSDYDKFNAFINLSEAQEMLGLCDNVSEIAIITQDLNRIDEFKEKLTASINSNTINGRKSAYEVLTYKDLLPLMISYLDIYEQSIMIFYMVIIIAILFGIVNTMMMAIFERIHEIGVIMSIGMKNSKIFMMIILEALVLGILGTLIGMLLGYLGYLYFLSGLDLSIFSKSLDTFGVSSTIYPILNFKVIINSSLLMPISAVIGSLWPAYKATKLQPTEAMRYV